jgi:hypothetical protein
MVIDMKVIGLMISDMEMESSICVMAINTRVSGRMERNVEKAYYILLLATSMMDIGWEG